MIFRFPQFTAAAAVAGVLARLVTIAMSCCSLLVLPAAATTFVFDETSSSVPGFVVSASITINNGFADLPTVSNINNNGPYPFGDGFALQAFSITVPGGQGTYTLADFTPAIPPPLGIGFPQWSISPNGISFFDAKDNNDFIITGFSPPSTIEFESDGPTFPPDCMFTGRCIATGNWEAVPEPTSAMLLISALFGNAFALRLCCHRARAQGRPGHRLSRRERVGPRVPASRIGRAP